MSNQNTQNESRTTEKNGRPSLKKPLLAYGITIGIGLLLVLAFLLSRGFFKESLPLERIRMLSDGFFIVGIMTACIGGLLFVSQNGAFDAISYSVRTFWWFTQIRRHTKKHETYREYRERLNDKPKAPFLFLVFCGLGFLAVAGIFTAIYMI